MDEGQKPSLRCTEFYDVCCLRPTRIPNLTRWFQSLSQQEIRDARRIPRVQVVRMHQDQDSSNLTQATLLKRGENRFLLGRSLGASSRGHGEHCGVIKGFESLGMLIIPMFVRDTRLTKNVMC